MGIIGSIRKHSGWAVAIVGIAILAFILGDLTKNGGSVPDVGKVNGETMTRQRFDEKVAEVENNYKTRNQTMQVPSEVEGQIREQVWQQFVDETLLKEQTDKLGLQVSPAELSDMYTGTFIHPYVRQSFVDPATQQFDPQQVAAWIENFDQIDTMRRMQWVELEKEVRRDRQQQKYNTLIGAGFYMPKAIASMVAAYGDKTANVRAVALPFYNVADDEVTVTDADYKAYYDEHRAEFRVREEMRDVEFITFPVTPTEKDMADIQEQVEKVWAEFQTTADDEMAFFVNAESERKYDSSYVKASSFKAPLSDQIAAAKAGDMIAPVQVDGEWMMAKVMKTGMRPDSLRASFIPVLNSMVGGNITRSDDEAKLRADSVLALLRANSLTFEQAVDQFSDDPQKDEKHGDMEWQPDGAYGFLNEEIINTQVGQCFVVAHPQKIGYFVVKVTGKTAPSQKYRVALVTREIVPSAATNRARYNDANRFAGQNRTLAEFESAAQQENLQVRSARVFMMADNMAGIPNARSIVQWVYNEDTKIGQVADQVYECDGQFVVVALKDVFKKGYATLEQVRPMIEQSVLLDKKGELLMARAEEAVGVVKDIASIAEKLGVAVDTVDSVAFNDRSFGRYGMEPKVMAAIATAESGLVGPVKGASGVYVLQVDSKSAQATDEAIAKLRLEQAYRSKSQMATQVLRDKAKITDQRNKHF